MNYQETITWLKFKLEMIADELNVKTVKLKMNGEWYVYTR